MKTILVPLDFSPASLEVTREARKLARLIGAQLVLLHVVEPPSALRDLLPVGDKIAPELFLEARRLAATRLEHWRRQLRRSLPETSVLTATGEPVSVIVAEAGRLRASYIVLGSHGHSSVYDMLIGSVAKGVQTRAPCPVVVIPVPGGNPRRTLELVPARRR